jgi:hypothetical protein
VKLVMALTPPDEPELLEAHVSFHLNAGVDLVLLSTESLPAVLQPYAREGYLQGVSAGEGPDRSTRMVRLAATEHGADWVIDSDSREYWWPRGESLKDVLVAIPPRYGIVQALVRDFVARPADERPFPNRVTIRRSLQAPDAPTEPPASALRPVYRAHPDLVVGETGGRVPLRAWYPIELLRFPAREVPREDEAAVEQGLSKGLLVVDTRLSDALSELRTLEGYALPDRGERRLTLRAPDVVDDAAYAVECAAVGEVDLAALDRHIRELENRIAWLEDRLWPRVLRTAARLVGRSRA